MRKEFSIAASKNKKTVYTEKIFFFKQKIGPFSSFGDIFGVESHRGFVMS